MKSDGKKKVSQPCGLCCILWEDVDLPYGLSYSCVSSRQKHTAEKQAECSFTREWNGISFLIASFISLALWKQPLGSKDTGISMTMLHLAHNCALTQHHDKGWCSCEITQRAHLSLQGTYLLTGSVKEEWHRFTKTQRQSLKKVAIKK